MGTERPVSYCFFNINANFCFEPLAIGIDQAEEGDRCFAGERSYFRNIVVTLFRFCPKNPVFTECFQALCFIYRDFRDFQFYVRFISSILGVIQL